MAELITVSGDVLLLDEEDVPLFAGKRLYTLRTRKLTYVYFPERVNGRQRSILAHRLIMAAPPGVKVDHKDCNGLNCHRENLRFATTAQNGANQRAQEGRSSCYKGVIAHDGGWLARVVVDGRQVHMGRFSDERTAARAYDRGAVEAWGEYARLNCPDLPLLTDREIADAQGRSSRFRGVSWQEQHLKWLVRFTLNGKTVCPGRFADEEDAAYVYDMAAREAGVPTSRLNFPDASGEAVAFRAGRALGVARLIARGRTSIYRGVSWYSMGQCWRAAIHVNRKTIILGNFDGEEDAARAYDIAAVKAWGVEALPRLNFPLTA